MINIYQNITLAAWSNNERANHVDVDDIEGFAWGRHIYAKAWIGDSMTLKNQV